MFFTIGPIATILCVSCHLGGQCWLKLIAMRVRRLLCPGGRCHVDGRRLASETTTVDQGRVQTLGALAEAVTGEAGLRCAPRQ